MAGPTKETRAEESRPEESRPEESRTRRPLPSRILVVAGPTAGGKSDLATEIASRLGAEIVGADSRQVYRYLDAATAKPEPAQRAAVPHHLIDCVDPATEWDVARWLERALTALADIHQRGRPAVVCGGTGLYLRSLVRGLFTGPPASPVIRERLTREAESAANGSAALHSRLAEVDPGAAARIHANDLVRIIRALEFFEQEAEPISEARARHALAESRFETLTLEVQRPVPELAERIEQRSAGMVRAGLLREVKALFARGYEPSMRAFDAIGYREAAACLRGELSEDELAGVISLATRRYAKRQRTWLRGQGVAGAPEAPGDATDAPSAPRHQHAECSPDDFGRALDLAERFFS